MLCSDRVLALQMRACVHFVRVLTIPAPPTLILPGLPDTITLNDQPAQTHTFYPTHLSPSRPPPPQTTFLPPPTEHRVFPSRPHLPLPCLVQSCRTRHFPPPSPKKNQPQRTIRKPLSHSFLFTSLYTPRGLPCFASYIPERTGASRHLVLPLTSTLFSPPSPASLVSLLADVPPTTTPPTPYSSMGWDPHTPVPDNTQARVTPRGRPTAP